MNKLLSPQQAAKMLNVTITTLRNWDVAGKIKAIRTLGGHRRYKLQDIKKIVDG